MVFSVYPPPICRRTPCPVGTTQHSHLSTTNQIRPLWKDMWASKWLAPECAAFASSVFISSRHKISITTSFQYLVSHCRPSCSTNLLQLDMAFRLSTILNPSHACLYRSYPQSYPKNELTLSEDSEAPKRPVDKNVDESRINPWIRLCTFLSSTYKMFVTQLHTFLYTGKPQVVSWVLPMISTFLPPYYK